MRFSTRHTKGHQNDDVGLDKWTHLNIECDYRAKCYLMDIITGYRQIKYNISSGIWQVTLCGIAVGTKLGPYLRKGISGAAIFEYWANTNNMIGRYMVRQWNETNKDANNRFLNLTQGGVQWGKR